MIRTILFISAIILISGCTDDLVPGETGDGGGTTYVVTDRDVERGRMSVKLRREPDVAVAVRSAGGSVTTGVRALDEGTATMIGITRMERTFPHAGKFEERSRHEGLHLWYEVWFDENVPATRAAGEVAALDDIEIAAPVPIVISTAMDVDPRAVAYDPLARSNYVFDDPDLVLQWGFENRGTETWQQAGSDIRIANVWGQYNGHPDIIIAIVDGGISPGHPDLQENIWINEAEVDGNGVDDDNNGYTDDVYGYNFVRDSPVIIGHRHGTHVAGTIGAINNNGEGGGGIAGGDGTPGSGVKLMNCQIFEHASATMTSDVAASAGNIAAAIKYGADNGAVISQNSWGYSADSGTRSSYINPTHKEAIDYFVKYAGCDNDGNQLPGSPMQGGIVLFASGNSRSENPAVAAPADYEKVIGVAAIGPDYQKAPYSNYGDYMDISAPGGTQSYGIWSTTVPERNNYEYRYGTSMSCPHVAGVAALVIQKYGVGKRGFTAAQLEEILLTTAYDIDVYNPEYAGKLGTGCVNAEAALNSDLPPVERFLLRSNTISDGELAFRVSRDMAGEATVTMTSGLGSIVMRKTISVTPFVLTTVDVSPLAAGYYTFTYKCNSGTVTEKIVKY